MTTWITICDTCKSKGWDIGAEDKTEGHMPAGFIKALVAEIKGAGSAKLQTRHYSCLMDCKRNCNITLQGTGKIGYSLGEFTPDKEAAKAIVNYAFHYAKSTSGQAPYHDWPQEIKGYFSSLHPPLPDGA